MRTCSFAFVLLAVAWVVAPAAAQEHRGVLYSLPNNWREQNQGNDKVLIASGLQKGEAVVVIIQPAEAATNDPPARQFETVIGAVHATVKVHGSGRLASMPRGTGTFLVQAFQIEDNDVGRHSRLYGMIIDGRRRALIIAVFKPESVLARYESSVLAVLNSIRLNHGAPPPPVASAPSPVPSAPATPSGGGAPTGNTPNLQPGMPGWLPSGRGVPIPPSQLVEGKPQGIWWTTSYGAGNRAMTFVFLPNGIHASNPRFGGGNLFDMDGQRRQPGANGVGPFTIAGGQITREYDGHRSVDAYATGSDSSGQFFKVAGGTYRPVSAPTPQSIVGTWTATGTRYVFHPGGSYESGQVASGPGWAAGSRVTGAYSVDGHLVVLRPQGVPITITPMGLVARDLLLINGLFYRKS
jgi:hypothetical protein